MKSVKVLSALDEECEEFNHGGERLFTQYNLSKYCSGSK
jgi:hypothetical protein